MKITPLKFILFSVVLLALVLLKSDVPEQKVKTIDTSGLILAFGDSLTFGKGAPKQSYPSVLEKLLKMKVINGGLSGESSLQGLKRLPSLLQKHRPDLVILCHGGNDLIQKKSKEKLKNNLLQMTQIIRQSGAEVLLVAVPNFKMIRFSNESLYAELAEQEQLLFEDEVLSEIENDKNLKSDRVHPNAKGYVLMAERFAEIINTELIH